jgi:hypothetical protein
VPGLDKQEEQRKEYEKAATAQSVKIALPALKPVPPSPPAQKFPWDPGPAACAPIPGSEKLLERPSTRWIVLGEMHGTNETPAVFVDLICLASRSRPVAVAVEQSTSEQPAIDAFIGSDGGAEATSRFLKSSIWGQQMKDGRSSEAYFRLFQRLRELRSAGRITGVIAFQPSYAPGPAGFNPADYENAMASTLIAKAQAKSMTLVLVGNVHAMRTAIAWAKPAYLPMAAYLPISETVALDVRFNGGSFWACNSSHDCGPKSAPSSSAGNARGITLEDEPGGPYSGALNLAIPVTSSPPQQAGSLSP